MIKTDPLVLVRFFCVMLSLLVAATYIGYWVYARVERLKGHLYSVQSTVYLTGGLSLHQAYWWIWEFLQFKGQCRAGHDNKVCAFVDDYEQLSWITIFFYLAMLYGLHMKLVPLVRYYSVLPERVLVWLLYVPASVMLAMIFWGL